VSLAMQVDSYLERLFVSNKWSYYDDYYDLYSFVPSENLRKVMAYFHTQLNMLFAIMNDDIGTTRDEDGNIHFY
jgi:hypothetical protein